MVAKKPTKKTNSLSGVKYTRDELSNLLLVYFMIRDCIDGEPAIKGIIGTPQAFGLSVAGNGGGLTGNDIMTNVVLSRARRYLPQPNSEDQSPQNLERYRAYVTRAVFYNVTGRTLEGMVGQIYLIPPVVKLPKLLEPMLKDADGQGLTMTQVSKRAVRYALSYGRAGIFTDYPKTKGETTQKQLLEGNVKPVIQVYAPWNIINWRTVKRGADTILSMVVLREQVNDIGDDGFTISPFESYRVLRLDEATGNYTVTLYSQQEGDKGVQLDEEFVPLDSAGKPFDTIPFSFIGSENNDVAVDKPPMYDIASLNVAHYRNSADYEEACFLVGQPTPVLIGLSEDWVTNVLKGTVTLGSRAAIPLPPGSDAKLIQASENSMPLEAMKQKEDQMVALGANLVIQKRVQRTATEAVKDSSSEGSILSNVADNVSSAMEFALGFAARFVGAAVATAANTANEIKFLLNKEFELNRLTMDDVSKVIASWQKGAIAFEEMRETLRKTGLATLSDDDAKTKIKSEMAELIATGMIADPFNDKGSGPAPNPTSNPAGHARTPAAQGR